MRNPYRYFFGVSLAACLTLAGCANTVVVYVTPAPTPQVVYVTPAPTPQVVYVTPAPTPQVLPFGAGVAGNVFFSQTPYDQGSSTCRFGAPIAVAATTDKFYMIAAFYDSLQVGDTYSLEVVKDGAPLGAPTNATASTKFDCYTEQNAMGPLPAGTYKFTFTHGGVTEAQGTITITP